MRQGMCGVVDARRRAEQQRRHEHVERRVRQDAGRVAAGCAVRQQARPARAVAERRGQEHREQLDRDGRRHSPAWLQRNTKPTIPRQRTISVRVRSSFRARCPRLGREYRRSTIGMSRCGWRRWCELRSSVSSFSLRPQPRRLRPLANLRSMKPSSSRAACSSSRLRPSRCRPDARRCLRARRGDARVRRAAARRFAIRARGCSR